MKPGRKTTKTQRPQKTRGVKTKKLLSKADAKSSPKKLYFGGLKKIKLQPTVVFGDNYAPIPK